MKTFFRPFGVPLMNLPTEMRLAAAIHRYKRGEISQKKQLKLLDWIAPISSLH